MARVKSSHVSFKPFVEIHKFGTSDAGSEDSDSGDSGSSCVVYSIDNFNEGVKRNQGLLKGPGEIKKKNPNLNDSLQAHNGCAEPWVERSKLLKKKLRRIASKESTNVNGNQRHQEDPGSDVSNPADTEMGGTPERTRKKKYLTKTQRHILNVAIKFEEMKRREMEAREEYRRKLQVFIEKAKKGKTTKSIVSNETEEYSPDQPRLTFSAERLLWACHKPVDERKLNFQVKAAIRHRINKIVDKDLRMAYIVILDNFDPILAPHFHTLFRYLKQKNFSSLEYSFILNK